MPSAPFLETLFCLFTLYLFEEGVDLPELHELHVCKRKAEPVRNERKVDYSSALVGPASSSVSESFSSPACSNVNLGSVRRLEMKAIA